MQQGILTVKLHELEREQGRIQTKVKLFFKKDKELVRKERERIHEECEEDDILLKQSVEHACSEAIVALVDAQLEYDKKMEEIKEKILPKFIRGNDSFREDKADADALYAEFCIDFAIRASKNALQASLGAIESEMECEEWRQKHE